MILILGGGLAGMSTAYHLEDEPHLVLEAERTPGGLCRSREIDGFVFDYTGHLLHLRDERAMRLIDELAPDAFAMVERRACIRSHGVTLPFPFQANLHGLPPDVVAECLLGFVESLSVPVPESPDTAFRDWSLAVFGQGISDAFMLPYNHKLFRRDPRRMTADWVSWAVPKPSLGQVVRGALGIENRGMGYNSTFRYPKQGGIDLLPRALAGRVKKMRLGCPVHEIDLERRTARLKDGEEVAWECLVNTLPLPRFLGMISGGPEWLGEVAGRLDWSVVACVNLGVDRGDLGQGAHWIYFPDDNVQFYRVGFPSNFSEAVAPRGAGSVYVEFGLGKDEPLDETRLLASAVDGLRSEGILTDRDTILVSDVIRIDPGYVIFDKERRDVLARVLPELEKRGIYTIGRYGAWTYSYMERALLDGLETAQKLKSRPVEGEQSGLRGLAGAPGGERR